MPRGRARFVAASNRKKGPAGAEPVEESNRARLADELLHFRGFALRFMPGVIVAAMHALLAKPRALPDQIVDCALQVLDPISQITRARWSCHGL